MKTKFAFLMFVHVVALFFLCSCFFKSGIRRAVESGDLQSVQSIIEEDPTQVNRSLGWGWTPLHYAVVGNQLPIIEYLIAQGADVNVVDGAQQTPLHYTVLHNAPAELITFLISHGADVNAKDYGGQTPLHMAATAGNFEVVKLLVFHGADVNAQNSYGATPLHVSPTPEIVKYLVSNGADVNARDQYGLTTLDYIKGYEDENYKEITTFLTSQIWQESTAPLVENPETQIDMGSVPVNRPVEPPAKKLGMLPPPPDVDFGRYFALVIGNNNYQYLTHLQTAVQDAKVVGRILERNYGFRVRSLYNATRSDILLAFGELRSILTTRDNLLVYYAGHGWLDVDGDEGYWLPVDAARDNQINWVSNSSITTMLRAIAAKHILIVADSCYSGKLVRGISLKPIMRLTSHYLSRIAWKKARSVLSSGGLEPVSDAGKGGHSVFASAFIDVLKENTGVIDGTQLYSKIRRPVMLNSDQTPEYSDIRKAGHDGGDFLFVRRK